MVKENKKTEYRLIGADVLKGIAILLMVYGHVGRIGSANDIQNTIVDYIYTFHMPLFLLLSGYFYRVKSNPIEMFKNTINKIFIPYFIFISIYVFLLSYINSIGFSTSNNVGSLSLSMYIDYVFLHPIGAYWFLHTLIMYQILFVMSFLINKKQVNWTFFIVFFFLLFLMSQYVGVQISIKNIGFLIIGFLLMLSGVSLPATFSSVFLILIIYLTYAIADIKENFTIQLFLVFSIMSFIMYLSNTIKSSFIIQSFAYIGRNTLVVLVAHTYFINVMKLFENQFLSIDQSGVLYSASSTLIAILGSLFLAYIFDYFNVSKYIFRIKSIYQPYSIKGK